MAGKNSRRHEPTLNPPHMKLILNALMATQLVAFIAAAPLQAACPSCGASTKDKDAQSKECPRKDKDDKEKKDKDGKNKDDKEKADKGKCQR
jgi:hypothetical protein